MTSSALGGLSGFTKAFIGPAIGATFALTQQYAAARFGPPPAPPPPPPEEPLQYLPPPGPYSTGATWAETFGTLGSMSELTALFLGIGACLGISAGLCAGIGREKGDAEVISDSEQEKSYSAEESASSEVISDFAGWAEKNYEKSDPVPEPSAPPLESVGLSDNIK
jgi:hypothetical protein